MRSSSSSPERIEHMIFARSSYEISELRIIAFISRVMTIPYSSSVFLFIGFTFQDSLPLVDLPVPLAPLVPRCDDPQAYRPMHPFRLEHARPLERIHILSPGWSERFSQIVKARAPLVLHHLSDVERHPNLGDLMTAQSNLVKPFHVSICSRSVSEPIRGDSRCAAHRRSRSDGSGTDTCS